MRSARPPSDDELEAAARRLGRHLVGRGWQMATAESCTGGMIGHVVTQVPNSSDHFLGGIVSYSNAAKEELLGIPVEIVERAGAVSSDVAEGMAVGALDRFPSADVAVAVTGIAGPDGGSVDKPVGLTWVAAARRDGQTAVERHVWPHDRDGNKRASVLAALELVDRLVGED